LLCAACGGSELAPASGPVTTGPQTLTVSPEETDPAIDTFLEDHLVIVNPSVRPRDELFVFLPGTGGEPAVGRHVMLEAANQGMKAVGIQYPNEGSVNSKCAIDWIQHEPPDADCMEKLRLERIYGIDASPLADVNEANGIVHRLVQLLRYLDAHQPGVGWAAYVDGDQPRWEKIVIAGHSQGGGMAALIGRDHLVARVLMFGSPTDFRPPGAIPADWITDPKMTPVERYFGFRHVDDLQFPVKSTWVALGLQGPPVLVEHSSPPFNGSHFLETDIDVPATDAHGSVIRAVRPDGSQYFTDVWRHMCCSQPLADQRYLSEVFADVEITQDVAYGQGRDVDGQPQAIHLDLYEPAGDTESRRPAIVWAPGGSNVPADEECDHCVFMATGLAKRGYVAAALSYRTRGDFFANPELALRSHQHNMQAAVRWLRANARRYRIDDERISVGGSSAGAFTALRTAYLSNDPGDSGNPGYASTVSAAIEVSGGLIHASDLETGEPPLMIVHGTADHRVPFALATQLCSRAATVNVPCELHRLEGADHGEDTWAHRDEIIAWTVDFLFRYVISPGQAMTWARRRPEQASPSIDGGALASS
jgi:acetyl esterase/lipase